MGSMAIIAACRRWSILQPYYSYKQLGSGETVSCTIYLPNNAAVRAVTVSHGPLAKDESRKVWNTSRQLPVSSREEKVLGGGQHGCCRW